MLKTGVDDVALACVDDDGIVVDVEHIIHQVHLRHERNVPPVWNSENLVSILNVGGGGYSRGGGKQQCDRGFHP